MLNKLVAYVDSETLSSSVNSIPFRLSIFEHYYSAFNHTS